MDMNQLVRSKGGHFFIENMKSSYDFETDNILKKLILTIRSNASEETNAMIEMFFKSLSNLEFRRDSPTSLIIQGLYTDVLLLSRIVPQNVEFNELELFLTNFGETIIKMCNAMMKEATQYCYNDVVATETAFDYLHADHKAVVQKSQGDDNVKHHAKICEELTKLYERKNHDYGDSFHQTYVEEGLAMSRIRLSDKLSRFNRLTRLAEDKGLDSKYSGEVKDESIRDTLIDLANYAIMTIMELDKEN